MNNFIYKYINTVNFLSYCINNDNLNLYGNLNISDGHNIEYIDIDNTLTNQ